MNLSIRMTSCSKKYKMFHRNKKRIQDLGEVFTPDKHVTGMLDMFDQKIWQDEQVVFFEPCCGHGNIVIGIYRRRLSALFAKHRCCLTAVAHALPSLWAIDIDSKNVKNCRARLLAMTVGFIKQKLANVDLLSLFVDHRDYFTHVLATIKWQIYENETLSALASKQTLLQTNTTKVGEHWLRQNAHKQIDFSNTWVNYFTDCETKNVTPIEFVQAKYFVANLLNLHAKADKNFSFANFLIMQLTKDLTNDRIKRA